MQVPAHWPRLIRTQVEGSMSNRFIKQIVSVPDVWNALPLKRYRCSSKHLFEELLLFWPTRHGQSKDRSLKHDLWAYSLRKLIGRAYGKPGGQGETSLFEITGTHIFERTDLWKIRSVKGQIFERTGAQIFERTVLQIRIPRYRSLRRSGFLKISFPFFQRIFFRTKSLKTG